MTAAAARRLLHAGTAVILLLQPLFSHATLRVGVVGVALAVVGVDVLRLNSAAVRVPLQQLLPVFRPAEERRLSGGSWLWIGYVVTVWLPPNPALAGILVGALADPAASVVGSRFSAPGRKTWQGSAAAFAVGVAALVGANTPLGAALAAALVGALVERWPWRLDDNLLLPPAVGVAIWALA